MSRRTLLLGVSSCVLFAAAALAQQSRRLAVGQMWSIRARIPTNAKLVIGQIEVVSGKGIVHVSLVDIPYSLENEIRVANVDHVPFTEQAVAASVDRLLSSNAKAGPGFAQSYAEWHRMQGATAFDIGVSEAIEVFLQTIARRKA